MLSHNETSFAAIGFAQIHRDGHDMAVVAVRGTYSLDRGGHLRLLEDQDVVLSDVYEGDCRRTPLVRAGDLVPFKPYADVTFLGRAHAPGDRPCAAWTASLAVGDRVKAVRVHGPRQWETTLDLLTPTWRLGRSRPTGEVALDYRLASGGRVIGDPEGEEDRRNPIGPGLLHVEHTRRGRPHPAPQIDSSEAPVAGPFAAPAPQGFGPLPPWWSPRLDHAGTYDEAWQTERAPRLPSDFSYHFYQVAPPGLVLPALRGNETVTLRGLTPGGGAFAFDLPGRVPIAEHRWSDGRRLAARLTLDGVHIDLRAEPWRVAMTWRGWIAAEAGYEGAMLRQARVGQVEGLPASDETGLAAGRQA